MEEIFKALSRNTSYKSLKKDLDKGQLPMVATGLSHIHKAVVAAAISKDTAQKILIITHDEAEMSDMYADLCALGMRAVTYPERDFCFTDMVGRSPEYEHKRIDTLSKILDGDFDLLISSVGAAAQYTIPPDVLKSSLFTLQNGKEYDMADISDRLINAGYLRQLQVEGTGQFAVRGGILDIFPVQSENPVRIEFFGDEIDSISEFDVMTQRRTESLEEIKICPASEIIYNADKLTSVLKNTLEKANANEKAMQRISRDISSLENGISVNADRYISAIYPKASIFDYLDENCIVLVSEGSLVRQNLKDSHRGMLNEVKSLVEEGYIYGNLADFRFSPQELFSRLERAVFLENFATGKYEAEPKSNIIFNFKRLPAWQGEIKVLLEDLNAYKNQNVLILAGEEKAVKVLTATLAEKKLESRAVVRSGGLSSGFLMPDENLAVITHSCIFSKKKTAKRGKNENSFFSLEELKEGNYVVHASHGIGIFSGIHKITSQGITKDYIKITYAKGDVLYVPVTQLDLISKYVGASENGNVKLNKLGSQDWSKTRRRVKTAVKNMAKELMALYAKRMSVKGYAFESDSELQKEFEAKFEFVETEDQIRSIKEIKSDMERAVPMDRLLCGDVGFGKTEVALRAAFKCISEGKQCALLVPTTILAWQHYNTALNRFGEMPLNVKMLSRFVTPAEQKKTLAGLKNGKVDMVIGTHRIISNDVEFKNLGLVIIDEEQRFGVAQKEKLKQKHPEVDVLTLSATPIPRTLNMAMSGLRDMSSIEEPPIDRQPVQSYVLEYDAGVVFDAIRRELRRSGQVYYLHNRVESITTCALKIKTAIPEARVEIAHGQMGEDELSRVWKRLIEHEIDILVCTTIIETGVDVPNANTLIIENAERMGLSQLHQLRGRVGRSPRRAYAYFCFRPDKQLDEIAEKRLEAIRDYTEFGAGFKIAMRDLEIRGAGNILGGEQHGNMEAVGYDMYLKLLNSAINEEKGVQTYDDKECTVDLSISAHIPESYIELLPARLGIYKKIAKVRTEEDKRDIIDELIDRFGTPPKAVLGLIDIALLRNRAAQLGITEITEAKNGLKLCVNELRGEQIEILSAGFGKRFSVQGNEKPYYLVKALPGQKKGELIAEISSVL
ncbi:MAG: transcription-repair coupling factor [Clostridiales bacterium]|nr:transcription-repair coupling factor [Candidatus Equinaster intestinalis]